MTWCVDASEHVPTTVETGTTWYPLSHLFIGLFSISHADLLKTHFLWLIPFCWLFFLGAKWSSHLGDLADLRSGNCPWDFSAISAKVADFVIMRQVWTTYLWSISVSAATQTHMSHIMSKFQAKQSRSILFPNKKLTRVLDTIPIGWLWSCQSTIEHFTFLWDEVCFFKTWCNYHLKQPSSLGCFCRKRRFFWQKPLTLSALRGKTPSCLFLQQLHGPFHQDLPAVIIHIQRCKNVCD